MAVRAGRSERSHAARHHVAVPDERGPAAVSKTRGERSMRDLSRFRSIRATALVLSVPQVAIAIPVDARPQTTPAAQASDAQAPPAVTVNRSSPQVTPVPSMPVFSDPPTTAELTRARVFEEPLLPVGGPPSADEHAALARLSTRS